FWLTPDICRSWLLSWSKFPLYVLGLVPGEPWNYPAHESGSGHFDPSQSFPAHGWSKVQNELKLYPGGVFSWCSRRKMTFARPSPGKKLSSLMFRMMHWSVQLASSADRPPR